MTSISKTAKIQARLDACKENLRIKENTFNNKREELITAKQLYDLQLADTRTAIALRKEKKREFIKKRNETYNATQDTARVQNKKRSLEIELSVALTSPAERKKITKKNVENINKGIFTDPLLRKVNQLPEVVVDLISTYLPLDVKIELIESSTTTEKLLSQCNANLCKTLLKSFCRTRRFLSVLFQKQTIQHDALTHLDVYYEYCCTVKEARVKIMYLIDAGKLFSPRLAYHMLKTLHILIDPSKKNNLKKMPRFTLIDMSMNHLEEAYNETNGL